MKVAIDEIKIGKRLRAVDETAVKGLAESLAEVGLEHPVVLTEDLRLVAGAHRIAAALLLGWKEIEATVKRYDKVDEEIAEIDENLKRRDLEASERAIHVGRRKELYEKKHPGARHVNTRGGGPGRGKKKTDPETGSVSAFVDDTAKRTGKSRASVSEEAKIYKDLGADTLSALHGTKVGANKSELKRLAAIKDKDKQQAAVAKIVNGEAKSVRAAVNTTTADAIRTEPAPLTDKGPYRVLVADPPWKYEKRAGDATHRAGLPYPDMTTDEICAFAIDGTPVRDLALDDSILWLWTTNAFMRDAFRVLDAWGFAERTILTWAKDRMGTGDWLRGKTEHCILAVRGRPTVVLTNQTTLLTAPLREHSRKPDEFYSLVEALCPGSRLEVFGRVARAGWVVWGGEATKFRAA